MFLTVFGLYNKKKLKGISGERNLVRQISEPKRGVEEGCFVSLPGAQPWDVSRCRFGKRISPYTPLEGTGVQTMSGCGLGAELQGVPSGETVTLRSHRIPVAFQHPSSPTQDASSGLWIILVSPPYSPSPREVTHAPPPGSCCWESHPCEGRLTDALRLQEHRPGRHGPRREPWTGPKSHICPWLCDPENMCMCISVKREGEFSKALWVCKNRTRCRNTSSFEGKSLALSCHSPSRQSAWAVKRSHSKTLKPASLVLCINS